MRLESERDWRRRVNWKHPLSKGLTGVYLFEKVKRAWMRWDNFYVAGVVAGVVVGGVALGWTISVLLDYLYAVN